jgi:hypothetical protein
MNIEDDLDDLGMLSADEIMNQSSAISTEMSLSPDYDMDDDGPIESVLVEPEPEPEPEPVPEPEPPAVVESEDKGYMIPKKRLDQEIGKTRAAQARALELEHQLTLLQQQGQGAPGIQLPVVEAEQMQLYHDAILDGQHAKAAEIMSQIRANDAAATAAQLREQLLNDVRRSTQMDQQQSALQEVITHLETTFDFFDSTSPAHDSELVDEVLDTHKIYLAKGYTPADAMARAARMVLNDHHPGLLEPVGAPPAARAAAPAPVGPTVAQQRAAAAQQVAAKVALQPTAQPARAELPTSRALDIASMTDEEFNALPDSKIREMRGDFVMG